MNILMWSPHIVFISTVTIVIGVLWFLRFTRRGRRTPLTRQLLRMPGETLRRNIDDLNDIFNRIAVELRAQYLLSYYSTNSQPDGKFRQISVSIPKRPDLRIRTRRGYYATMYRAASNRVTQSPASEAPMFGSIENKPPSLPH